MGDNNGTYMIRFEDIQDGLDILEQIELVRNVFNNQQFSAEALELENGLLLGGIKTSLDSFEKFKLEVSGNSIFYDNINMCFQTDVSNMIAIQADASNVLAINTTGAFKVPVGFTSERPIDVSQGQIRFNKDDNIFEGYGSGAWQGLGGVRSIDGLTKIIADDSSGILFFLNDASDAKLIINEAGNMGFGNLTPSDEFKLDICGNVHLTGTIVSDSDRSIKDNIQRITNSIETIDTLHGYSYTRKDIDDKTQKHVGVIAQEVEEVYPELVFQNKNTNIKSVNYNGLCAVLIECVKDLKKENQELRSKMDVLEQKINELAKK